MSYFVITPNISGLVHDRLLNLEEERIKIEKQKLLEKKRCNNIRLKMEKDRLEIEKQRNILLEKLVNQIILWNYELHF